MSKKTKIFLGALAVVLVGVVCVYLYINQSHPNYEKLKPVFTMTPKSVYDDFKADAKTTSKKYNGKMIELNGKISKIEASDTLVTVVFAFTQGLFGDEGVRCAMLKQYNAQARLLKNGDSINIKGLCQGYNETDVILEKCSLVK